MTQSPCPLYELGLASSANRTNVPAPTSWRVSRCCHCTSIRRTNGGGWVPSQGPERLLPSSPMSSQAQAPPVAAPTEPGCACGVGWAAETTRRRETGIRQTGTRCRSRVRLWVGVRPSVVDPRRMSRSRRTARVQHQACVRRSPGHGQG